MTRNRPVGTIHADRFRVNHLTSPWAVTMERCRVLRSVIDGIEIEVDDKTDRGYYSQRTEKAVSSGHLAFVESFIEWSRNWLCGAHLTVVHRYHDGPNLAVDVERYEA